MTMAVGNWFGFVGQEDRIALVQRMHAAQKRSHLLLSGPPGTGKTTIAQIVSQGNLITIVGNQVSRPEKLAALLQSAKEQAIDTLFIDEVHSASKAGLELLYPVMETGKLYAFGAEYDCDMYIVAATTDGGQLPKPFRDRFRVQVQLRTYNEEEMGVIVDTMANNLGLDLLDEIKEDIARRSGGTPRIARSLVENLRQFQPKYDDAEEAAELLDMTGYARDGLQMDAITVLNTLWHVFDGGPVGLTTLAMASKIDEQSLIKYIEPALVEKGLVVIEKKGRLLTPKGVKRLL